MIICLKGILEKYFSLNANVNDSPKVLRDLGRLLGIRALERTRRALGQLRYSGTWALRYLRTEVLGHLAILFSRLKN